MNVYETTPRARRPHPFFADDFFNDEAKPRIFGHRGFVTESMTALGVLENTRVAFAAALAAGAGFLESDCLLTSDGRVVLVHDTDLLRLFGDERKVSEATHAELVNLFANRGGLLALDEALEEFPDAHFNIDVKSAAVAGPAGEIVGSLAPERVLITSFSDSNRKRALAAATSAAAGKIVPATSASQRTVVKILVALMLRSRRLVSRAFVGIDAVQIPERLGAVRVLNARLLAAAHAHGVEVHVWTVNDPHDMQRLAALGVDGLVTDRTDIAVSTFHDCSP